MTSKSIGSTHKPVTGPDGRTRLVVDRKAKLAKLDVSKRIAARENAKNAVKFKRGGK